MFTTLNPTLEAIASQALAHCKGQYGSKGLRVEQGIDPSVAWRPTFYLNVNRFELLAVEVSDVVYPDVLKGAGQELLHHEGLIRVAQVAPLETFVSDKDQKLVQKLRDHGVGLFTVAPDGKVVRQFDCAPIIQFIPEAQIETQIKKLPLSLKVLVRAAYQTFRINPVQGVQEAGQIVEGLVNSMARQTATEAKLKIRKGLADQIDEMYPNDYYKDQRAALGAARGNARYYRNPTSHAPKTAKAAAQRMRQSREGFLSAVKDTVLLAEAMRALKCRVIVYD
jgi:hypothetical protein